MIKTEFFTLIAPGAQSGMGKYGVLASVTMAQAALESGYGKSTTGTNNIFGIKANGWANSKCTYCATTEEENGKTVSIKAWFRNYDSIADCIEDHGYFLAANSRYANLIGLADYVKVCTHLQYDGYATESNYAAQLVALIKQYSLTKYDILPACICIDSPGADGTLSGAYKISGWALAPRGIARIDCYFDDNTGIGSTQYFTQRKDVLAARNKWGFYRTLNCGWAISVPKGKISKGKHTLKIAAIDYDGKATWATFREFTVR